MKVKNNILNSPNNLRRNKVHYLLMASFSSGLECVAVSPTIRVDVGALVKQHLHCLLIVSF
jgi:hypothetical protein